MWFFCSSSNFGAAIKLQIMVKTSHTERVHSPKPSLKASEREGAWQRPWPWPRSIREKARREHGSACPIPWPEASERERELGQWSPQPLTGSVREGVCGSFGSLKALTAAACRTANWILRRSPLWWLPTRETNERTNRPNWVGCKEGKR